MSTPTVTTEEEELLRRLGDAVDRAPRPVQEIEVGVALSIALGRSRPSVSCGGCEMPLSFRDIPATTNARLKEPFRLVLVHEPAA